VIGAGAIATIAPIALGGCGASSAVDPVASAAGVTQRIPGARIELRGEIVSPLSSRPLEFSGSGTVSSDPASARLRFDFAGLLRRGAVRQQLEVRTVGRVFYMTLPSLASRPGGKRWLKIDLGRAARAAAVGTLPSVDELDPVQYLNYLRAVSGGLTTVGSQVIRGASTVGYRGEIDLERVAALTPPSHRDAAIAAVGNLEHITGVSGIPFQVWIDARHRVRRISIAEGESSSSPTGVKVYITLDFVSFGRQGHVATPPSREVLDVTRAATARVSTRVQAQRSP
jgi:hypothetical protein